MSSKSGPTFKRVQSRRLFEEVCSQIQDQITSGHLKPGDRLPSERELAVQFGISRPAVREALRSLEFAGLLGLRRGPRGGSIVLDPQSSQASFSSLMQDWGATFAELTEARILLQEPIIRLASERIDEAGLKALEHDIRRTKRDLEMGTAATDPSSTQAFYAILAEATGNRVLGELVIALSKMVYQAIEPLHPPLNFDLVEVRTRFVERLRARDAEGATKIMTDYLRFLHGYISTAGQPPEKPATSRLRRGAHAAGTGAVATRRTPRQVPSTPRRPAKSP